MLTKKLNSKSLINTNIILIIIIVILIGLLGFTVGYGLLKSQPTQIVVQNTTNSSPTVSNNTDIQQSNGKSSDSNKTAVSGITATKAKEIALNYIGPGWDAIYVGYEDSDYYSIPCYQVEVRNPTTHVSQDLYVDAKTGDIINP